MIEIELLGPLGNTTYTSNATSLHALKKELQEIPEISVWLKDCAIAINNTIISSLDTPIQEGDKIALLPPVCGG